MVTDLSGIGRQPNKGRKGSQGIPFQDSTVEVVTYLCKSWIIYETPMTEASVVHRHLPYLNFINFKVHIFFVPGQRKKIFANK